jgi:hypothetical protein
MAALEQIGIKLSQRTCGRLLQLNRNLYGLEKPKRSPHTKKEMPFRASFRHQYWSVDVRYIEKHQIPDHTGLSRIGFLGGREGKDRSICYDENMNISPHQEGERHVLPGSIIVLEAGSVKRLCALEPPASVGISALECRHRPHWKQRDQSSQCSAGAGVGTERSQRDPTTARVVAGCSPQTGRSAP